jgi:prepilin-type N-terminal cleavage/methylation domain-containing protein
MIPPSSREKGLTLVECAAALAIAAIVLVTSTRVSQASASLVRRARLQADATDLARNLLEHELGAPCGASFPCPPDYRCSITRAAIVATADHLTARVERIDGEATEELSTLAPVPSCGG